VKQTTMRGDKDTQRILRT